MKFTKAKPAVAGPSSSIGIMRFFDTEASGPKITPEFVVVFSVAVIILVLALKFVRLF